MRALAQILLDKEKGPQVFEEYMKTAFPWIETMKGREKNDFIKYLNEEIKRGPLGVQKLWENKASSRLRTKVIEVDKTTAGGTPSEQLYKKMGRVIKR